MIPSQRPMMLASALRLSQLVQKQEVLLWSNFNSMEQYINTLKAVVEKLSNENNLLTSYHLQIMNKVSRESQNDVLIGLDSYLKLIQIT